MKVREINRLIDTIQENNLKVLDSTWDETDRFTLEGLKEHLVQFITTIDIKLQKINRLPDGEIWDTIDS